MRNLFRLFFSAFLVVTSLLLVFVNVRLYYSPEIKKTAQGQANLEVIHQLQFLKHELRENHAGRDMQKIFPEGFVFINALYGLAWYGAAKNLLISSAYRKEALAELAWAAEEVLGEKAKNQFNEYLRLPYGAFYRGWSNYLLAKKLQLQQPSERKNIDIQLFKDNCMEISSVLSENNTPYLESYQGMAWPADMVVCMASLALHDKIFQPKYTKVLQAWLQKVQKLSDPETGLIPHAVNYESGYVSEGARGSSQSLMLVFLREIDLEFAQSQFQLYKKYFLTSRLGMSGIREYPKGKWGMGDIDSGPVLLGVGGAASIVGLKTMALYGENGVAIGLRNSIEGFGLPFTNNRGDKKYLWGVLPMADAFIAWGNATTISATAISTEWRWWAHVWCLLWLTTSLLLLFWMWGRKRPTPQVK